MRVLIVEDEKYLAEALLHILKKHKYTVDVSLDGAEGLDNALSGIYDAIILDVMLPSINGYDILKELRVNNITTPVLMLTAMNETDDLVKGLDLGADDYLGKPFEMNELLARLRAITRRKDLEIISNSLELNSIKLDLDNLVLSNGSHSLTLTLKEAQLVELLIFNKDRITSKSSIIEKLWGFTSDADDNNVEVYISFIRKKLLNINANVKIITIRNLGYKMEIIK
ncbi:MAG: response regulator transcription factor [bacterium]